MINFVKWYLKNIASHNEATTEMMMKYLIRLRPFNFRL